MIGEDQKDSNSLNPEAVDRAFRKLQDDLTSEITKRDKKEALRQNRWSKEGGGGGISRAVENGLLIEKGGVNFSRVSGSSLPIPATATRPSFAGRPYEAIGVSVVFHPRNPYAPTAHMNVRAFFVYPENSDEKTEWWFGGGFDLTPCYGFDEDAIAWHKAASDVCKTVDPGLYRRFKVACDEYFYLPHRQEQRGIGGIFYDDFNEVGFENAFQLSLRTGSAFGESFFSILDRRHTTPFGDREKEFQRLRRGRYVEFNLLYDRGTRFGLASGGRTESILMSMPLEARWSYDWKPQANSPEALLHSRFLQPRDWLAPGAPLEPIHST
ncbi:MAG: oxygen-dependent coproporphyrinogen oxidase [Verrucomicrobiota bacterium]